MITVKEINKSYGTQAVLTDVSFSIGAGQKVALVGANGVGKSTLLRLIAGLELADSGVVEVLRGACLGYLPQDADASDTETIEAYLRRTSGIALIEERMKTLQKKLTDPRSQEEYSGLEEQYVRMDGYAFSHRMGAVLGGFGLADISPSRSLATLSGGERSKVALSAILLKGVDVLLLDEPTNNLDLPALIWLEEFLRESKATCVIVSHDRRFLDRIVSKVFEIDWHSRQVVVHRGGYSDYLEFKAKELRRMKAAYAAQQDEIKRLEQTVHEKKRWAGSGAKQKVTDNDKFLQGVMRDRAAKSAKRAKAVESRLEQMEKIEKPRERPPLEIPLEPQRGVAAQGIRLEKVVAGYDGFRIGPITLDIPYGSRMGIMGVNGSGKSTLLKTITGELEPCAGKIVVGSSLIIGNLMQSHEDLGRATTLAQYLMDEAGAEGLSEQKMYFLLRRFGFESEEARKPIRNLSPGGRARLIVAGFALRGANVLVLDEPTNHLDIEAIEALEEVLETYTGSVILVSHDRYFLERAHLTETLVMEKGNLRRMPSYESYVTAATAEAKKLLKLL